MPAASPLTPPPVKPSPSRGPSPSSQSPLILQPLPLQVGGAPLSLPTILNPALIEASSPVPLLPVAPRPTSPAHEEK